MKKTLNGVLPWFVKQIARFGTKLDRIHPRISFGVRTDPSTDILGRGGGEEEEKREGGRCDFFSSFFPLYER